MSDRSILLVYFASLAAAIVLVVKFVCAIFSKAGDNAHAKHPYVIFMLLSFVLAVWLTPWGAALGYVAASHDLAQGHHYIKKCGLVKEPFRIYERLLKDRYDIRCLSGPGCMPMPAEVDFANTYNAISRAAILKHFGRDVLAECMRDAQNEFHAKHEPKEEP